MRLEQVCACLYFEGESVALPAAGRGWLDAAVCIDVLQHVWVLGAALTLARLFVQMNLVSLWVFRCVSWQFSYLH